MQDKIAEIRQRGEDAAKGCQCNSESLVFTNDLLKNLNQDIPKLCDALESQQKAAEKIMVGFNAPKFDVKEKMPLSLNIDLSDPEIAYLSGWESAIIECGEILAKAKIDQILEGKNGKD